MVNFHGILDATGNCMRSMPAGLKLICLLLSSAALVVVTAPVVLVMAALLCAVLFRASSAGEISAGYQISSAGKSGLFWWIFMLAVIGTWVGWQSGVPAGVAVVARLVAMFLLASAVMRTTSLTDMMAAVEAALAPLARRGYVNSVKVSLMFGMMIRFLPLLKEQWDQIRQAQASRCMQASFIGLLVPMLVNTLRRADEIAQALDARNMGD